MMLPKIAMGAWAWGNDGTFGGDVEIDSVRPVFEAAMDLGFTLWDTAFVYGMGTSEKTLGKLIEGIPRDAYLISDKLTPQCMDAADPNAVSKMIETEKSNLGINRFDICWIHNPVDAPHWTEAMAEHFEGRSDVPLFGVSNHNLVEIKQASEILKAHGLRLSCVQNHYSLLNRSSETSGILDYCRNNGIEFFAYMVLEQGALSGKYDLEHPMPSESARGQVYNPYLAELEKINDLLAEVASAHNVDPAQIPIAWAIAKGTLPIVGVTQVKHVEDAVKAAGITLSNDEVEALESMAASLNIDVVRVWEKEMK